MRFLGFLLVSLVLLQRCTPDKEECVFIPDTSSISIKLNIDQLEDSLVSFSTKQEMVNFFTHHPVIRDYVFNRPGYPSDSVFINELFNRFKNPGFDTLHMETKNVFGDLTELKNQLTTAFSNLTYYYPNFQPPRIETLITGLETDLYVSDSLIVIGLDYYLGPGAKYRPNMYEYMVRRYQEDFIVPSILLLYGIDGTYNKTNLDDRTVLADMIAYGKAYYFAKHMLPCVPDSVFIGYTTAEMKGSRENSDLIWKRLVEDEVLYSTSYLIKQKYISERPKTLEVGEKCPGRIATWVGWEIVDKFSERNSEPLPQLMAEPSALEVFNKSKYRPL